MIKLSNYGFNILQLETYGLCNMECGFCPYPLKKNDDKKTKLDEKIIKNVIDQIDPNDEKFKYITFSHFNEPLLDVRIFDFVKYAKEKGLEVHFITNGLLFDKDHIVQKLIQTKPVMKISLQIIDSSKHEEGRGLNLEFEKYFEKIVNFINKVKNENLNVTIDVGCNFQNNSTKYYLKKILGLDTGDPNIPHTTKETLILLKKYFGNYFNNVSDKNFLSDEKSIYDFYLNQEGIKLSENITIKIKPFLYGRRIDNYFPINDNFSCNSDILSIQSTGNVVPCCLVYDESLSLGNIFNSNLSDILQNNLEFFHDLKTKGAKKHLVCKKCFGEPTKRGRNV